MLLLRAVASLCHGSSLRQPSMHRITLHSSQPSTDRGVIRYGSTYVGGGSHALMLRSDRELLAPVASVMIDQQRQGTLALPVPPFPGQYDVIFVRYPPIEEAPPLPCM